MTRLSKRLPGTGKLLGAMRWARRQLVPHAVILAYHRVGTPPTDPQELSVSLGRFQEQLHVIRALGRPIGLAQLAAELRSGRLPKRAVAVTFDDGYADNLYAAAPALEAAGVPGTVFVTTGHIEATREFFWDELGRILLGPESLPPILRVPIAGRVREWHLGVAGVDGVEENARRRAWSVLKPELEGPRQRAYRELCGLVRPLDARARDAVLDEVLAWSGMPREVRDGYRTMTRAELVELGKSHVMDIGAHSVTHPVLALQTPAEQRLEVVESKRELEVVLGRRVTTFAYPFGGERDYSRTTMAAVRGAGFECACANYADAVWRGSDRFGLPRFIVRDWDEHAFADHLQRWLGD